MPLPLPPTSRQATRPTAPGTWWHLVHYCPCQKLSSLWSRYVGGFHLYLSKLAFINQFYSIMTRLVQLSLANDYFRNHFTISSKYFDMVCYLKWEASSSPISFEVHTTRINILTFLVVLTNWMKVLIFIHRKRLGLCQNDCGIDVLKFSTYAPRFCTTVT